MVVLDQNYFVFDQNEFILINIEFLCALNHTGALLY